MTRLLFPVVLAVVFLGSTLAGRFGTNGTVPLYPAHVYGVDISQSVSEGSFSCLNANNLTFAIARCWHSNGGPDTACPGSVANAWRAGVAHVDVYMFPCYSCGDPAGQVNSALQYLSETGTTFGMYWLDVEGPVVYLSGYQGANRRFFEALKNEVSAHGVHGGVYTSASQWEPIFGSDYTGGSDWALWYAHYDGIPSFDDFRSFGGWSSPSMKQFSDAGAKCGASYDINWYPAGARPDSDHDDDGDALEKNDPV